MINSINIRLVPVVLAALLAGLVLMAGAPGQADAHTSVQGVSANSKVLRIVFSGPIRRGTIRATNARGRVISRGRGGRDPRNVMGLRVGLKNVRSGSYRAKWTIVAIDGHRQSGTLRFRVR